MDPAELEELADSIRQHGILEPLLVRELLATGHGPEGRLELLAGERRLEAAKLAGLASVPVRVLNVTDQEAAAIALTENLAREDLTVWEEAGGLAKLREHLAAAGLAHTVRDLAPKVGWSTGKVSERLQIADAITPAVLERSRADVHAVNKLPKAALLLVSQGGNIAERVERLARYILPEGKRPPVARKPGRPAEAFTLQSPKSGRVAFRLRKPAAELEPEEARAALERLEPVLEALRARAEQPGKR
jgi:ParB family chromosome partitioning protein